MSADKERPGDLPYDYEDLGLDEPSLKDKYGATGEHPAFGLDLYQCLTEEEHDSFNGYWDWVVSKIAKDDELY